MPSGGWADPASTQPEPAAWAPIRSPLSIRRRGSAVCENLNVVDLSVFPILTSGNTYVPVAALAWRAAEMIIAQDR